MSDTAPEAPAQQAPAQDDAQQARADRLAAEAAAREARADRLALLGKGTEQAHEPTQYVALDEAEANRKPARREPDEAAGQPAAYEPYSW
ncbi:hypothetical protein SEA_MARSHAWN_95 [Mycobacterium phage Marshawn]|uniref:Uncharacterized protein n=1 Tax=Mycobacterium phage Marshawn TaxID=2652423 RepID=A0A5P8D881_9CAUD|nr:hypothetical protein I5H02_gp04 [Mycobacterium phage Marshawn]QFP94881.1 hypothetical protein SEA_MARSHAWN_95 [Mycobacterium phage Marshawn]